MIATRTTRCGRCAAARAPSTGSSTTSGRSRDKTRIAIGGNFDMETADSYPALLDFLKEQDFADKLSKVALKPIIRERKEQPAPAVASPGQGLEVHRADRGQTTSRWAALA